jgi:hypothetical protein
MSEELPVHITPAVVDRLLTREETLEAERDRALRQRDHARQTAHAWYVYFLSSGEHVMDAPECPPNLSGTDDDGWDCQVLNQEEERIIGCPPRVILDDDGWKP